MKKPGWWTGWWLLKWALAWLPIFMAWLLGSEFGTAKVLALLTGLFILPIAISRVLGIVADWVKLLTTLYSAFARRRDE